MTRSGETGKGILLSLIDLDVVDCVGRVDEVRFNM